MHKRPRGRSSKPPPSLDARSGAETSSPTPHDALFKETFSRPEHARAMLRDVLPKSLSARVDWRSLKRRPGSFVNEELREHHTDLLFSARLGRTSAYFYVLFEHQSTADRWMLLRLLEYMIRIWRDHLAREPKAARLPPIVPVVLHHSETGWTSAAGFEELLDVEPEARGDVAPYVPSFRVVLDDVSHASDEDLRSRAITALGKLVLGCFRHSRDMQTLLRNLVPWAGTLSEVRRAPNGMRALALVLRYMFRTADDMAPGEIRRLVGGVTDPVVAEDIVSLADKLIEQGRQEGLEKGLKKGRTEGARQGRAETVLKLLQLKFGNLPAGVTARVRGATGTELDRWTERVLTAPSLTAVLDG